MRLSMPLLASASLCAALSASPAGAQTAAASPAAPSSSARATTAPAPQVMLEIALMELDPAALGPFPIADVTALTDPRSRDALPAITAMGNLPIGIRGPVLPVFYPVEPVAGGRTVSWLWHVLRATGRAELLATPMLLAVRDQWADIGLRQLEGTDFRVRVRPQINDAGEIRLDVEHEVHVPGEAPTAAGQRVVRTALVTREGQSAMLRGREFYRTVGRELRRRMHVLVVTPHVITREADLRAIFEARMRERQEYLDHFYITSPAVDERPPADYARTRGMLEEIRQAMSTR